MTAQHRITRTGSSPRFGDPDTTPNNSDLVCSAVSPHGAMCTRAPDHDDDHAAGDGRRIVAVWPATTTGLDVAAIREDIDMAHRSGEMARHVALDHGTELCDEIDRLRALLAEAGEAYESAEAEVGRLQTRISRVLSLAHQIDREARAGTTYDEIRRAHARRIREAAEDQ